MVAQSDWLPMMMATGFATTKCSNQRRCFDPPRTDVADYRNASRGRQARLLHPSPSSGRVDRGASRGPGGATRPDKPHPPRFARHPPRRRGGIEASRNNVRGQLVLDETDAVAQRELALFEPLDLEDVGSGHRLQRLDRSIEVAMLLPQPFELRFELGFLVFGHSPPPPNANRVVACPIALRKSRRRAYHERRRGACPMPACKAREPLRRSGEHRSEACPGGRDNSGGELNSG